MAYFFGVTMTTIFAVVILLLLLQLMKQAMPSLHPLFTIIFTFIFLQFVFVQSIMPWARHFLAIIQHVPYARSLLYTALVFLISEFMFTLLADHEYEALGEVMRIAVRIALVTYWMTELEPAIQTLSNLLKRV